MRKRKEYAMEKRITAELIEAYSKHLILEEKSKLTIEKYLRDIMTFKIFIKEEVTKENVIAYKHKLIEDNYALRSVNSMLASINSLFDFAGWNECKVKSIKIQQEIFCAEEKEISKMEYERLTAAARKKHNERLALLIQTICGTGIRVSELKYITIEAIKNGLAQVNCKGKNRRIFIVKELRKKLLSYAKAKGIIAGPVFVTRKGKPMDRTNIWREMKQLCKEANVSSKKVFPHNLRHLFARTFYKIEKDIAKLADILGHSSINTTRIYIVSTGFEHQKRMESMKLIL